MIHDMVDTKGILYEIFKLCIPETYELSISETIKSDNGNVSSSESKSPVVQL